MTVQKFILVIFTCSSVSLITATKNDCGGNGDNTDDSPSQFLSYIKPLRYQVYIDPCISDGNFSGYVNVDLLLLEPTKNLSLHAQELEFCEEGVYLTKKGDLNNTALKPVVNNDQGSSLFQDSDELSDDSSETIRPFGFVYHKIQQIVTMKFKETLKPGKYSLEINYLGTINLESVGIYRQSYKDLNGEDRVLLLANTFPTSARQIFPCRDEPAVKAEMYFTMQTSLNFTTVLPGVHKNYVEYKEGQRWTHSRPIVNTSTYQLNFAVLSNMKNVTKISANRTYVTYATASDLKSVKLAQDTYMKILPLMEDYTKVGYPLNTLTTLVIPEKNEATSSATLGLISTKKSHALYNERSGPEKKRDVVLRSSRDVVSQWFTQIISPASWKYLWLNEGLTEYMKYYLSDKVMPKWRLKEMFVIWELQRRSFIPNKFTDGHPLNKATAENPNDIKCLLTRSFSLYSRGASIIRMMSHFLSEKTFHYGIINFMKTHRDNSAMPNDLWKAMQCAVKDSNDKRLVDINVTQIMKTWTDMEFYPILNVTRNYETGSIQVTQTPAANFFELSKNNSTNKWWIPISYTTQSALNFNETFPRHWLRPNNENLKIDGVKPKDWIIFNIQQTGYYRVLYDEENWRRLAAFLNSPDYQKISPVNRAQIMNDAIQFSLKRQLDMGIFLDLISYLEYETDYVPWYDAQFIFSFLDYHLSNTQAYPSLKRFGLRLIVPLVDKIGYEDRPNDDFPTLLLRRISNHWACHFGYEKCWKNATKQLEIYLENNKTGLGSVDLQEWARCVGLNGADITIWNKMFRKYTESSSEDALIYLACSENSTILNHFLDISISNESSIPQKQLLSVFKSVCLYPSGDDRRINLCLDFIDCNFDQIKIRLNRENEAFTYLLDLLASEIRQKPQLEKFKKIMAQDRASFASDKLGARIQQTESRVLVFEQKANYYEPFLKARIKIDYEDDEKDC